MPASYQAPRRSDAAKRDTQSQTLTTNLHTSATTVAQLMDAKGNDVFSIRPQDTIETAAGVLRQKRIGALVVTDAAGKLIGILSERDIVRKLTETPGQTLAQKVEDVMTKEVQTCTRDTSLIAVLKSMTEGRFRHMPVMEGDRLAGILTIGDVINHRLKELEHEALQLKQLIVG